jgi:hypothetical protein
MKPLPQMELYDDDSDSDLLDDDYTPNTEYETEADTAT